MRFSLFIFLLISSVSSLVCKDNSLIEPIDPSLDQPFVVKSFKINYLTKFIFRGKGSVTVTQGKTNHLIIHAHPSTLARTNISLEEGVLIIEPKVHLFELVLGDETHCDLTVTTLNNLTLEDRVSAFLPNYEANNLKVTMVGNSAFNANIIAKSMIFSLSGDPTIRVRGKSESVNLSLMGEGHYRAKDLITDTTSIDIDGQGYCTVNVKERLSVRINGNGKVLYSGNPKKVEHSLIGNGTVEKE